MTRETNWTPGLWTAYVGKMNMTEGGLNPFFRGIVALLRNASDDQPDVAVILDRNDSAADYEANANLIAASPALYASLETIVRGLREGWWGAGSGEMEEGELQAAETALRQARGEQTNQEVT